MANLSQRVTTWTTGRTRSGVTGLVLMHDIAEHIATQRDWDAAARFFQSTETGEPTAFAVFKLVLRARFGKRLKVSKDSTHKSGFKFKMDWKADEIPVAGNSFGIVNSAISNSTSFSSKAFVKELRDALNGPREEAKFDFDASVKRTFKRLDEVGGLGAVIRYANALVEKAKSEAAQQSQGVVKKDTAEVIDIDAGKVEEVLASTGTEG